MNRKWIFLIVLPVLLVAVLLLSTRWQGVLSGFPSILSVTEQPAAPAATQNALQRVSTGTTGSLGTDIRDSNNLQYRIAEMRQRRRDRPVDEQAVAAAVARTTAWETVDRIPASLPLKAKERNDGRQFIRFDPLKMESLIPGDELTVMTTSHGNAYRAHIDSVEVHDNGRVSWTGHLEGLPDRYSMTFTRGDFLTVGGINTPEGHYELQSHGETGWIASSKTLSIHAPHSDAPIPRRVSPHID